jgi:transcriptional regulator with XRE-family HTH domain
MTGAQLHNRRTRAKISLRGLAARLQISPSYLCDLEKGKRTGDRAKVQLERSAAELRAMVSEREKAKGTL